jgi:hypothetical protein
MKTEIRSKSLTDLPEELQNQLDTIIQAMPNFWSQKHLNHFTLQGVIHSERILRQKLAQIALELPERHRLSPAEIYIVSAAAYLFEIGLQSRDLSSPILSFSAKVGDPLSCKQLEEIRAKKHLLTKQMLLDYARSSSYRGLDFGLTRDEYAPLVADVCGYCSDDIPINDVEESIPISGGFLIRLRLLVALLRLANQMYIDASRIDFELLERAWAEKAIDPASYARWWVYYYAQTMPIDHGQVRFYYFLPVKQKVYAGHIRGTIEPLFEFENNQIIQYLQKVYDVRLSLDMDPNIRLDQADGFQNPIKEAVLDYVRTSPDVLNYLQKIDSGRLIPTPVTVTPEKKLTALFLDYENLILHLSDNGYSFTPEQITEIALNITSLAKPATPTEGFLDCYVAGHWNRSDLLAIGKAFEDALFSLVYVEDSQSCSAAIESKVGQIRTNEGSLLNKLIFVEPNRNLGPFIKSLVRSNVSVFFWLSDAQESDVYKKNFSSTVIESLTSILGLVKKVEKTSEEIQKDQFFFVLHMESAIFEKERGLNKYEILQQLKLIERMRSADEWWYSYFIQEKILIKNKEDLDFWVLNDSNALVKGVIQKRDTVIDVFEHIQRKVKTISESDIVKELQETKAFGSRQEIVSFLKLLQSEGLVYQSLGETDTNWGMNIYHWSVISRNASEYFYQLIPAIDLILVIRNSNIRHERMIEDDLNRYLHQDLIKPLLKVARLEGWVFSQEARNEKGYVIGLSNRNLKAAGALRAVDIAINILCHRAPRDGVSVDQLWDWLCNIRSFTPDQHAFYSMVDVFKSASVLQTTENEMIYLNYEEKLTRLLIGRMYVYEVIRNTRIIRSIGDSNQKPLEELRKNLTQFVTRNRDLTDIAIEYAEFANIIKRYKADQKIPVDSVILVLDRNLVNALDKREQFTVSKVVDVVARVATRFRDGWVPRHIVWSEMDNETIFGYSRGEHDYWIDQAAYRAKKLETKRDFKDGREVNLVRLYTMKR